MRAVSLYRPWGFAFRHLGKRIENRDWQPALRRGEWIALHSAQAFDKGALEFFRRMLAEGRITASAPIPFTEGAFPAGVIEGVARFYGVYSGRLETSSQAPWRSDAQFAWLFDMYVPLPRPVACRGYQSLWIVPPETLSRIEAQLPDLG